MLHTSCSELQQTPAEIKLTHIIPTTSVSSAHQSTYFDSYIMSDNEGTQSIWQKIETQLKTLVDYYEKDVENIKANFYSQEHGNKTLSDWGKDLDEQRKLLHTLEYRASKRKKDSHYFVKNRVL